LLGPPSLIQHLFGLLSLATRAGLAKEALTERASTVHTAPDHGEEKPAPSRNPLTMIEKQALHKQESLRVATHSALIY
jgi:hypothetical protein